jgi:riboflavin-specific deaminase-like protein
MSEPSQTRDPAASTPPDWPALWDELLRERRPVVPAGLSPGSAALLSLYQPLLVGPWCVAQLGQSLDGCVATLSGDSYFVTGAESLLHLHRLRALCDAVLVGAGTVAADNPQLTTRRVPGPQPTRVVLDPGARLDGRARVFTDAQAPTLWLCDARHADAARAAQAGAAEVLALEGLLDASGTWQPARVVATLAARGLHRLFVEGGGVTVSRFLGAGCLDRLHLVVAPVLIGNGRRGLQLPAWATMADCPRLPAQRVALGDDTLWNLDLRAAQPPLTR